MNRYSTYNTTINLQKNRNEYFELQKNIEQLFQCAILIY